jgi:peptidyl-prolyl cis-trans isomerase D
MALIGEIRKNSWILVVMVGLGLGGFILMDMTSGQQSLFGSSQSTMAEVNGNKLDINEFTRKENVLYRNSSGDPFARRNVLWNYYVENFLVNEEAEALGLGVGGEELRDLTFGTNLSPVIQQLFRDQATQQINREALSQYQQMVDNNSMDPSLVPFWLHQEDEITKERLKDKMTNMVLKGMYVPTWMAEMVGKDQNKKVDFTYVRIPWENMEDSDVALEESDYQKYLDQNYQKYEVDEEVRKLAYVVFDVIATREDSIAIRDGLAKLIPEFEASTNDSIYVENNYGSFDPTYASKDAISPAISDTVFSLPVGTVYGPYVDNGAYNLVKIADRKVIPDSVRSRHILIPANTAIGMQQALRTVDSLKNLIEAGTHSFDSLALQFGSDGTATKGGDLGYVAPGSFTKPFNDLVFYQAEPNTLYSVATEFGAHLVEVTGTKYINNTVGARLAYVREAIIPSETTQDVLEDEALEMAEANPTLEQLAAAVAAREDLELETSPALNRNDYFILNLGSGQASRDMIRWAFGDDPKMEDPSLGDVSTEVYRYQDQVEFFNNKYVIVGLKTIQNPGKPTVDVVREEIEAEVIKEKKAELFMQQIGDNKSLSAIAAQFNVAVDTMASATFSAGFIQNAGAEPKVVAKATQMEVGSVSEPIQGNTGVFVISPSYKDDPSATANIPQVRRQVTSTLQSQVRSRLMNALRKNASIEDYRYRFF